MNNRVNGMFIYFAWKDCGPTAVYVLLIFMNE